MKILLLGNQGQLGRDLMKKINETDHVLLSYSRKDFDFSNYKILQTHTMSFRPDIIINAAAYTKVDKAESDKDISYESNARLPEFLANYCFENEITLIHFSSDYVFSGNSNRPYKEDSVMEPINYYGYCKQQGDLNIMNNHDKFFILRTSWVYSKYKGNFLTKVVESVRCGKNLNVVNEQIGIPTSANFIAKVVMEIINDNYTCYGTYNVVPDGCASWYEFSAYIVDKLKDYEIKPVEIKKISTNELNLSARRPLYSVLGNEKLKKIANFEIKDWRYYVDQLLQEEILDT